MARLIWIKTGGLFLLGMIFSIGGHAQSTQFRGELRDGHYNESGLMKIWPNEGPELLVTAEGIGTGYSSVIYDGENMYVAGMKDTIDFLSAVNMKGEILWQKPYGRSWLNTFPDTRSTPTLNEGKLYVLSGTGRLSCFESKDGELVWSVQADSTFDAQWNRFGVAESPLVVNDIVITTPGGDKTTLVAFNKNSGELIWKSDVIGGKRSYASAVHYVYNNLDQIISTTSEYVFGVDPMNGTTKWKYHISEISEDTKSRGTPLSNPPVWKNYDIYISCGYDVPSIMLTLNPEGTDFSVKWIDTILDSHHHGFILLDDKVYSSNWQNNRQGNYVCLDWNTGEKMYEEKWETKGSMIYADSMLYVYEEKKGNMALIKPDPKKFEVVSSFKIDKGVGMHWAHPSIYDKKLFIRHGDVLLVYNLAL